MLFPHLDGDGFKLFGTPLSDPNNNVLANLQSHIEDHRVNCSHSRDLIAIGIPI